MKYANEIIQKTLILSSLTGQEMNLLCYVQLHVERKVNNYCLNFHYGTVQETICPIHHRTRHIDSSSIAIVMQREFRWHKDNTKSGYIHRRRTFSPTDISPVRPIMDVQVVWGDKTGGKIYILISLFLRVICIIAIFANEL